MNGFLCKISYEKVMENGSRKKVTESYLVDALSFTEAEARIIKEMEPYVSGEFEVLGISRYPLSVLSFNDSGDRYYKAKIFLITLDENSLTERKTAAYALIQASDFQEAKDNLVKAMKEATVDYTIDTIKETKILDVFQFNIE